MGEGEKGEEREKEREKEMALYKGERESVG